MDLKVYALLNEKIKELAGGGLTQAEVEKIVTDEVAKIVAGAPEDFDTLKEMSDWISSHEESAASMNSAIQTNANDISALDTNKVDKVAGKSLISDTEIARLAKVTNYDDSGVKADIQTNADNIDTNKTNISTLAKHVTGDLTDSDFSEDSTVEMTKTVPSGMTDYAAVKVIGGRTQKMVQLTTSQLASANNVTLNSSASIYSNAITYKQGHVYMMSAKSNAYPLRFQSDGIHGMAKLEIGSNARVLTKFTCNYSDFSTGAYIYNTSSSSYTVTGNFLIFDLTEMGVPDITVEEFKAMFPESYYPYTEGELWNAATESVVSVGKNIAEFSPMTEKTKMNIYGAIEKGKFLKAGKYTLSYQSDYTAFLQVWLVDNMTQIVKDGSAKTITFTLPSDGKYSIYFYKDTTSEGGLANANIRNLQLEKSNEATPYTQHFKTTLLIPESDRNLSCFGYGIDETIQNVRDYENGTYTQMVAEVDLGNLADSMYFNQSYSNHVIGIRIYAKASSVGICSKYSYVSPPPSGVTNMTDKSFAIGSDGQMYIRDSSITDTTDVTQIKSVLSGTKAVYQLATPVVTECSDILHPIRCEAGGTITFNNEHNLDIPNTVIYKKEVSLS